jgi:hypothetical protein
VSDPYGDGKPYFQFTAGGGNYPDGFHIAGILSQADAELIARAPDLLAENSKLKGQLEEAVAALHLALRFGDAGLRDDVYGTEEFAERSAIMTIRRALLSKLKEA